MYDGYMLFTVVLIAIILLPAIVLTLLKTNAVVTFLSLCAGYVLLTFIAGDAILAASLIFPRAGPVVISAVQISLLILPVILSALVLRGSVVGPKLVANTIPALALGLVAALLIVPLLPSGVGSDITKTSVWMWLDRGKSFVAGTGVLFSLMTLWFGHKRSQGHGKAKHH